MRAAALAIALLIVSPGVVAARGAPAHRADGFTDAKGLIDEIEARVRELERTGADLSVFFGIPSEDERARVLDAGGAMLGIADRARAMIADAVERADRAGVSDDELRDELITANAGQLPIRAARAALLVAGATLDASERRAMIERSERALGEIRATSPWIDLERRTLEGIGELLGGDPLLAIKRFDDARVQLANRDPADPLAREFTPAVVLGLIRATREGRGWSAAQTAQNALTDAPPFETVGEPDPALAVVLADVRFAIQAARAEQENTRSERGRIVRDAFAHHERLASRLAGAGLDEADAWRLVCAQACEATEGWMERSFLPPVAKAGLAFALMDAEATRADGTDLAREALGEVEPGDALHGLISWELARALALSGTPESLAEAARIAGELARRDPSRTGALDLACTAAVASLRLSPSAEGRARAIEALRLAHERNVGRDLVVWRRALGLALAESRDADDLREAIDVLREPVPGGGPDPVNALAAAEIGGTLYAMTHAARDASEWLTLADAAGRVNTAQQRAMALQQQTLALLALDQTDRAREVAREMWAAARTAESTNLRVLCAGALLDANPGDLGSLASVVETIGSVSHARVAAPTMYRVASALRERVAPGTLFLAGESAPLETEAELLERLAEWGERSGERGMEELARTELVAARLLSGDHKAALEAALRIKVDSGPSPNRLRLEAEARLALGDDAGAFQMLRVLAGSTESDAATEEHYWYAWARMLEILERQNAGGERTAVITREITRLRATDGYDSCAECVERIEAVASKIGI